MVRTKFCKIIGRRQGPTAVPYGSRKVRGHEGAQQKSDQTFQLQSCNPHESLKHVSSVIHIP
jgi:hypothetical protein